MAFKMSLPFAKRVKQLDGQGLESHAQDEDLWALHSVVHKAIQDKVAVAAGQDEEEDEPIKKPGAPNPQRVLEKLLTARGEVDVILDLVTFVEQQQFVGVTHLPRKPSTLDDLTRDRALRLAHRRDQLKACSVRLAEGADALEAQAQLGNRFLGELGELRRRWKLRRHGGKDGLFYVDLMLPLAASVHKAVGEQPRAQWNLLQDTNGDVCMVDKGSSGRPHVIHGWRDIHVALQRKQGALTWHVVRQLLAYEAQQAQQGADPDSLAAVLGQLADAAAQESPGSIPRGAAGAAGPPDAGPADMDIDGAATSLPAPDPPGPQPAWHSAQGGADLAGGMRSTVAAEVQGLLHAPGFQSQFRSKALLLLRGCLRGPPQRQQEGAGAGSSHSQLPAPPQAGPGTGGDGVGGSAERPSMLRELLAWLRHRAASHRVEASLRQQVEQYNRQLGAPHVGGAGGQAGQEVEDVGPVSMQGMESGAEFVDVWRLEVAGRAGGALVIVCEGAVRMEGALRRRQGVGGGAGFEGPGLPEGICRVVGRGEVGRILAYALQPASSK